MIPPSPVGLYHFTHLSHLPSVVRDGLVSDSRVGDRLSAEAGEPGIKDRRRRVLVPAGPGGVVADYVPFYFAPRSPMLFRIFKGGVPTYSGSHRDLVYLCTTVEQLVELGLQLVFSDRNAAKGYVAFRGYDDGWQEDGFIDWALMKERDWFDDTAHPDRKERRMAECLVAPGVPWAGVLAIAVADERRRSQVQEQLAGADHRPRVLVRPNWYF